jgi:hypothetical protein
LFLVSWYYRIHESRVREVDCSLGLSLRHEPDSMAPVAAQVNHTQADGGDTSSPPPASLTVAIIVCLGMHKARRPWPASGGKRSKPVRPPPPPRPPSVSSPSPTPCLRKNREKKRPASSFPIQGGGGGGGDVPFVALTPTPPCLPYPQPSPQYKVPQKNPKIGFVAVRFLAFLFIYSSNNTPAPSNAQKSFPTFQDS